ncbi:Retrovirus-related Pol polyprotein from transposon TNT 1-94 [Vitis vinifera]|uniref:Retrovirus-related Pol polyprotein from transposon TNT 1-94 n=1 Tax=Vitis vinifera TaxID=29760 RepID=A0A438CKJ6_VITVI|nr:Retrovirus-related Pol polyprotein from transposon TNT 1-94 [Vitis vinifera]
MAAAARYKVAAAGWNGGALPLSGCIVRMPSDGVSGHPVRMKSTSGYVFILGESAVSWKFAKKTCITRSIIEIEFIALENASSEVEWLRNILTDIPLWMRLTLSVSMRCDSQVAIAKSKSKILNGKNKHICLRHNIVRQLLETKNILDGFHLYESGVGAASYENLGRFFGALMNIQNLSCTHLTYRVHPRQDLAVESWR